MDLQYMVPRTLILRYYETFWIGASICKLNIRELLEKADRRIFKKRSSDAGHPLNNILPKHKENKYNLRVKSSHCPKINTSGFHNAFV